MEVGENRVHVFYGTKKREKRKDSVLFEIRSTPGLSQSDDGGPVNLAFSFGI
jgi:hypothetical protein